MIIELQETKVKEMEDKKLFIGTYWLKHNKDLYPTKFNALLSEAYEPGKYNIDFKTSTYRNKYNQLCLGTLTLTKI